MSHPIQLMPRPLRKQGLFFESNESPVLSVRGSLATTLRYSHLEDFPSPVAHRGGRVIDTLPISLVSHVLSDGQEHSRIARTIQMLTRIRAGLPPFSPPESGSSPGGPTCASTSRVPPFDEYRF